ncbi:hypothetical protein GYMLUDRAFT_245253 [Collybiopsis luxurians FD-317 M1]|uniref:Signal recognition particle receptor subunit beta n=1 Tax=Collybiopsis luxurians FD-317 M1 TaxID=944289 RepID=A0A0D0CUR3_9AGAR|nr:hypothetical protein GYMLUDRAFT_245253 [Collybiopsis luxurians FD-317 M1]
MDPNVSESEYTPVAEPKVDLSTNSVSSQTLILASLFAAVILIAIFVFVSRRKSQSKRNVFLLTGPSDSGKTAIFSSLIYGNAVPTNTSMQSNSSFFTIPGKKEPVQVVDVPGHPRLRSQFKESLNSAKAIAFVVDANTISRNAAHAAEHLHTILDAIMSFPPSQSLPTLLILAHKSDLIKASSISADTTALAINRVQTILERELERRRQSQLGGMGVEALGDDGVGSSGGMGGGSMNEKETGNMGGLDCTGPGGMFKFENWEGGEVVFLGTSVRSSLVKGDKGEKAGIGSLDSLREWIEENM